MDTSLDWLLPIAQRLARAGEIGDEIEETVKSYRESDAIEIEHLTGEDGVTNLVLRIHRQPPARLALLVGECVHQLRSALDNLMVALADQAEGVMLPTERIRSLQFPISDTTEAFAAKAKRYLKGLPENVVSKIEEVQPYHLLDYVTGEPQPIQLWDESLHLLRELSNHDKHRRINVLHHRADHLAVHHSSAVAPAMELTPGYLQDGVVVATVDTGKAEHIDVTTELAVAHPITASPLRLQGLLPRLLWQVEAEVIPHITGERDLIGHPSMRRVSLG